MSIDPVTTDSNTGSGVNLYAYANNSAYKYIDQDCGDGMDWLYGGPTALSFRPSVCGSAFSAIESRFLLKEK